MAMNASRQAISLAVDAWVNVNKAIPLSAAALSTVPFV
jgi:hypothetical protein